MNVFDPNRIVKLVPATIKDKPISKEEQRLNRKINKVCICVDRLNDIQFLLYMAALVALGGTIFSIIPSYIIYRSWAPVLIGLVVSLGICLLGLMITPITAFLWHRKLKLESKLLGC